jgi:hypothetical protein
LLDILASEASKEPLFQACDPPKVEFYMVKRSISRQVVPTGAGHLCLNCLTPCPKPNYLVEASLLHL